MPGGPAAPPPAARTVKTGTKTEREVALERDVKARETRISELEDENRTLKTVPAPRPSPAEQQKKSFLQRLDDTLDL